MVNVYRVTCKGKGNIAYKVKTEGESKDQIVKESLKEVNKDYGFNLVSCSDIPIIENIGENEYAVLIPVEITKSLYISVNEDESLLMNSVRKFSEDFPGLIRITNFEYVMDEDLGPDENLDQCFKIIKGHFKNKDDKCRGKGD